MRTGLVTTLVLSLLLGGGTWYQKTADICPVPLSYRIGTIDPQFGIDEAAVKKTLAEAEAVWETQVGRELFTYDENGSLIVEFIYDERQATSNSARSEKEILDERQAEIDALKNKIAELQRDYDEKEAAHKREAAAYEVKLNQYNEEVRRYNDMGGAPADVFASLEATRRALDADVVELNQKTETLQTLAATINELGATVNELVTKYNADVEQFNREHDHPEEFTQGDYQDGRIRIYEFSDQAELITVLVHEFGHALGLSHVEGKDSIMYYLLENPSVSPVLSSEDKAAFLAVCGTGDELPHTVRRVVRSLLP